jgi:hypothetical protein
MKISIKIGIGIGLFIIAYIGGVLTGLNILAVIRALQ